MDRENATAGAAERSSGTATSGRVSVALVERARTGDVAAFDALVERVGGRIFRTARAILRNDADAADAAQETFFQAWRDLPRLRDPERFDAWLGMILMNRCRSGARRRRTVSIREVHVDDVEMELSPSSPSFSDEHAEADAVRRAFATLREDDRLLLAFHHVAGHSVAELGSMTGRPVGTVKSRLHAARAALERALEAERR